jgi:hypothetical protein
MYAYFGLNQTTEAKGVFNDARSLNLDGPELREARYLLAFLDGDRAAMLEQVQWATDNSRAQPDMWAEQAGTFGYFGRLKRSGELALRAAKMSKEADSSETGAKLSLFGFGAKPKREV